jgi:hypothetical protein
MAISTLAHRMKNSRVQHRLGAVDEFHEGLDTACELKHLALVVALIDQLDAHAVVEEGKLAQSLGENIVVILDQAKYFGAGHEVHFRAASLGRSRLLERSDRNTIAEFHLVYMTVPTNGQPKPLGQGIYHRNPNSMQAARYLVGIAVELAAGMQHRHDDFRSGST